MNIRIRSGDIHLTDLRTRIPFKYGIATMTKAPYLFLRLTVEIEGHTYPGIAADLLPPKWFTKNPARPLGEEVEEMLGVIEHALQVAVGVRAVSPFEAWQMVYFAQADWGRHLNLPPLLWNFGTSLVERSIIHATCQAFGMPFAEAARENLFRISPSAACAWLVLAGPAGSLPARPLESIVARHTVGLADPLEAADIAPAERLDDGLPQSLVECIRKYGLRHFKIKVSGHPDRDLERLRRLASLIPAHTLGDFVFTLDGNEQFHTLGQFQVFWESIERAPDLRDFFRRLRFVEQPFHRDVALNSNAMSDLAGWRPRPLLIIDESDAEAGDTAFAMLLGYDGTSHKNCKSVFRSIANACLLADLRAQHPERQFIHSGEDLANIGPVALLQDLAVCAALGIESVERNGHHYFAGLSMFPARVQQQMLEHHGDLYHPSRDGWPTLAIRDGVLDVRSVVAAPFGVAPEIDVEQFTPLDVWRATRTG